MPEPTCSVFLACIALCWDWNCNNAWSPKKRKLQIQHRIKMRFCNNHRISPSSEMLKKFRAQLNSWTLIDPIFTYEVTDPIPYNAESSQEQKSPIPITEIEGEENKGEKEREEQNRVETEISWPADFWKVTIFSTKPWGENTWCSTSTVMG